MKFIPILVLLIAIVSCKKSGSDNGGQGNNATVTFTNNNAYPLRVVLSGTGADTANPFINFVMDIDVAARSSVQKNNIPPGTRKLVTIFNCMAQQPFSLACTTSVFKRITYLAGQTYTENIN
ncbi:MAG TPA: hypothetical protein PLL23_00390 [Chitinophagaceae bacterium]|nr:hypothetical protein [Chitinophagaceae bacterium]